MSRLSHSPLYRGHTLKIPQLTKPPIYTGAMAVYPMNRALADRFVGTSRFSDEPVVMWRELPKHNGVKLMGLPRQCCPVGEDRRSTGVSADLKLISEPRDAQQARLLREATALLDAGESFQLQGGTGIGKTWLALALAAHLGRRTCIVLHKADLFKQWRKAAKQFLGVDEKHIGVIKQDKINTSHPIVLASIQTLALAMEDHRVPARVLRDFGFVVWDECHVAPAETFMKSMMMFPALHRLGLTATPKRQDGKDYVTRSHIGPVRVKGESVPMQPNVFYVNTPWRSPRDRITQKRTQFGPTDGWVYSALAKHRERNQIITRYVSKGYNAGRRQLVLSHQRAHLGNLALMAIQAGVPESDIGFYVGQRTDAQLEEAADRAVIFGTFKMADTGTDIDKWDAIILATPRAQVAQAVGRVLRSAPGKKTPVVVDLVDGDSPMFYRWAEKRGDYYRKIKADIRLPMTPARRIP